EGRALARRALEPEPAAVQLDELARDGKPEPRALGSRRAGANLAEFLEHGFLVLRRDADAGVAHRYLDAIVVVRGRDADRSALRSEFQGVRQEVEEDLLDLALVGLQDADVRIHRR